MPGDMVVPKPMKIALYVIGAVLGAFLGLMLIATILSTSTDALVFVTNLFNSPETKAIGAGALLIILGVISLTISKMCGALRYLIQGVLHGTMGAIIIGGIYGALVG